MYFMIHTGGQAARHIIKLTYGRSFKMIYSHEPDQLPKFEPRIMKEETKTPGN